MGGCVAKEQKTQTEQNEDGPEYDKLIKIVFVGDVGVGKSSIILKYTEDIFTGIPVTTIGDNGQRTKIIEVNKKKIKLQIWDTEGSERYKVITISYYRAASVAIIVFDLGNEQSFKNLTTWINEIKSQQEQNTNLRFCIVGNKCDDESRRVISTEVARSFAEENYMPYFETSAKDGTGIEETIVSITNELLSE